MKLHCVKPLILLTLVLIRCDAFQRRSSHGDSRNLLLLVIFDGFRHDYLGMRSDMTNFNRLINEGVKPDSIVPVFATKTIPERHTMVTGLYQENHGIIGNRMYDPKFDSTFNKDNTEEYWWNYGGEPIWVTNQKKGGKTISIFSPGDGVKISGCTATFHEPVYDENMPFNARVDKVVRFMSNGSANLGLLYYHEPDRQGHTTGPDSEKLKDKLKECDGDLGYLLDQLTKAGLKDRVNLIVTSDHGMTNVSPKKTVFLDKFIDRSRYFYTDNNPVFGIWPQNVISDLGSLYRNLSEKHPNMAVYLRAEIPNKLHYRDNRRVSPILIVMDQGWNVWTNKAKSGSWDNYKGNHGYIPSYRDMHGIFIASGPDFKSGHQSTQSFKSIEIYNLMCHLLGISPAPNNGKLSNIRWLLNTGIRVTTSPSLTALLVIVATMVLRDI